MPTNSEGTPLSHFLLVLQLIRLEKEAG